MTRLAFTADLHIDSYGARVDPATGLNARLVDFLATTRWVADEAWTRGASALVIAGDFTERRHPAPWLVSRIRGALANGPGRQVYLRGNHDGSIAGHSIVSVLDDGMDHSMGIEDARSGVSRPGLEFVAYDVVLACIPHLDRHWLRAQPGFESVPDAEIYRILGEQFVAIASGLYAEARRDYPDAACVLVCHQTLAGALMSETQAAFLGDLGLVVDARALQAIGFDAVVAGHLHRHQVVLPGDRPVLYCGSIERVDFGEELEPKGFIIADVERGRFTWEFVETPARAFVTIHGEDQGSLEDLDDLVRDAVVRVVDLDPTADPTGVRAYLEACGAFEITEIRQARPLAPEAAGGMSESLSAEAALEAYFAGEPDAQVLVELGRGILEAVA